MVVELTGNWRQELTEHDLIKYRNNRTGARSTRTQIDHDVFEGLPVRHWRKRPIIVNTAPDKENTIVKGMLNPGMRELPMPRDANLLSPMSQALLRAARMGHVKRPSEMEDEKEPGEEEDAEGDLDESFVAQKWAVVPKDMEGPEPEYLAKRRKGLPSVYSGTTGSLGDTGQMRKLKIRKTDADGKNSILEVMVPEGRTVEGEIVQGGTSPTQAPAPGTVIEGVGVANADGVVVAGDLGVPALTRRRPPPPKPRRKKPKGPFRRRKQVAFASAGGGEAAAAVNDSTAGASHSPDQDAATGLVLRGGEADIREDSVMRDVDQDGEEGSEEVSEGDEAEEGDREEGELSPSPSTSKSPPKPPPEAISESKAESRPSIPQMPAETTKEPANDSTIESADEPMLDATITEPTNQVIAGIGTEPVVESKVEHIAETTTGHATPLTAEIVTESISIHEPVGYLMTEDLAIPTTELGSETTTDAIAQPAIVPLSDVALDPLVANSSDTAVMSSAPEGTEAQVEPSEEIELASAPSQIFESETKIEDQNPSLYQPSEQVQASPTQALFAEEIPNQMPAFEPLPPVVPYVPAFGSDQGGPTDLPSQMPESIDEPMETVPLTAESQALSNLPTQSTISTFPLNPTPLTAVPTIMPSPPPQQTTQQVSLQEPTNQPSDPESSNQSSQQKPPQQSPQQPPLHRPSPTTPQTPTPSPPTPIKASFSALTRSPRAPTMSPPTPNREISSSPDLPLAAQHARSQPRPEEFHTAQEANVAPLPGGAQAIEGGGVDGEAAPNVLNPQIDAEIPPTHDPLDGLVAPEFSGEGGTVDGGTGENRELDVVRFEDGEEDLLGTLERSLGPRGRG